VTFKIDQMYAEFISDETWTLLTGGAGEEKTWYLDLDAEGISATLKVQCIFTAPVTGGEASIKQPRL
jgi:hypothetical protein